MIIIPLSLGTADAAALRKLGDHLVSVAIRSGPILIRRHDGS